MRMFVRKLLCLLDRALSSCLGYKDVYTLAAKHKSREVAAMGAGYIHMIVQMKPVNAPVNNCYCNRSS